MRTLNPPPATPPTPKVSTLSAKRRAEGPAVTKKPKRPVSAKSRWKRVGKWVLILGLVGSLLAVGGFIVLYQAIDIPDPNEDFETQTTFVYYSDGKSQLGQFATQNRESITLDEMPDTLKDAVVAAENRTFWTDQGIDPKGIIRAAFSNAQGNNTQGASTITQQYVKILYLTQERTLTRKIKEAFISLKLQRDISKEQILEGYLNTIYFGRGAYGVQAAAKAYFDMEAKDLDLQQSAVLASVLNDPNDLDPAQGKRAKQDLKGRYGFVLDAMAEEGMIEAEEADRAARKLPAFPEHRGGEPVRRPEGPRADDGPQRADPARLQRGGDRGRRPAGHHHLHQEGDGRRGAGCRRGPARRLQRQGAPHRRRHASSPAPARCAASSAARTSSTPRSTGRSRAARPARR